ncbi:DNA polymerase IV [Corynebacterium caspium]|uniref:DNA polymerase IV n=1 Tax=Corynebacterium caspium TaxID=234828 RepID=UPI000379EB7F|nr:DNA polymerase IV [Corynebacterium caspium]
MARWVLHLDMDAFFTSCEQLTRPTLRGRPVIVGGRSGRGVAAGVSYEARKFGARSAMPMHHVLHLVGYSAVIVPSRIQLYRTASTRVFEVINRHVDVVEQLSIDEGFMEPSALVGASVAEVQAWAEMLRQEIRKETGLSCSIGAGSGKQFAKIGSDEGKPDGVFVIPHEEEIQWLHPLDVSKLWGVGPVTKQKLNAVGIKTIGDLANLDRSEVQLLLGSTIGIQLWELARGIDPRPVVPRAEAKSVSAEHTYPQDLLTKAQVDAAITRSAEEAYHRLVADGRAARTISVKLRMADFRIESRSATLPYATDNLDTLKAVATKLVRYPDQVGAIRLVGVGYSGLEEEPQHVLFPELDSRISVLPKLNTEADYEVGVAGVGSDNGLEISIKTEDAPTGWRAGDDVHHLEYGHGWVQGAGKGVVSVRFESRTTGPGKTHTFAENDPNLVAASPLKSLDWDDWLAEHE